LQVSLRHGRPCIVRPTSAKMPPMLLARLALALALASPAYAKVCDVTKAPYHAIGTHARRCRCCVRPFAYLLARLASSPRPVARTGDMAMHTHSPALSKIKTNDKETASQFVLALLQEGIEPTIAVYKTAELRSAAGAKRVHREVRTPISSFVGSCAIQLHHAD
jgi:hypothetical protein